MTTHKSFASYRELSSAVAISFATGIEHENRRRELMAKKATEARARNNAYWQKFRPAK